MFSNSILCFLSLSRSCSSLSLFSLNFFLSFSSMNYTSLRLWSSRGAESGQEYHDMTVQIHERHCYSQGEGCFRSSWGSYCFGNSFKFQTNSNRISSVNFKISFSMLVIAIIIGFYQKFFEDLHLLFKYQVGIWNHRIYIQSLWCLYIPGS